MAIFWYVWLSGISNDTFLLIFVVIGVSSGPKRVKKELKLKPLVFLSSWLVWCKCRNDSEISVTKLNDITTFCISEWWEMFPLVSSQKRVKFGISKWIFTVLLYMGRVLYMGRQKSGLRVTVSKRMFVILLNIVRSIIYREISR